MTNSILAEPSAAINTSPEPCTITVITAADKRHVLAKRHIVDPTTGCRTVIGYAKDLMWFSCPPKTLVVLTTYELYWHLRFDLSADPHSAIIRGVPIPREQAEANELALGEHEVRPGQMRRAKEHFEDRATRLAMLDFDLGDDGKEGIEVPRDLWPLTAPGNAAKACEWFIKNRLPAMFQGVACVAQLSGSMGSLPEGRIKLHLFYLLDVAATSAQAKQHFSGLRAGIDPSLFQPVQMHYTAAPVMDNGAIDPFAGNRLHYIQGRRDTLPVGVLPEPVKAPTSAAKLPDDCPEDCGWTDEEQWEFIRRTRKDYDEWMQPNATSPMVARFAAAKGTSGLSEADMGRAGYLMWVNCGNWRQTLRMMQQAPWSREDDKWEGGSLERSTLPKVYGSWLARPDSEKRDPPLDPALVFGQVTQAANASAPVLALTDADAGRNECSDAANGARLAVLAAGKLIYVAGRWMRFDGLRWVHDEEFPLLLASKLPEVVWNEAVAVLAQVRTVTDEDARKALKDKADALFKWSGRCAMANTRSNAVAWVRPHLTLSAELLDADPWLLCCRNGTVDLRTGAARPSRPEDYCTKLAPVDFDPAAQAPTWLDTVAKICGEHGKPGQPIVGFLARWFGYCATGSTREQCFVIHHGGGSNGKSTILETMAKCLGDYAGAAAPGLLVVKKHGSDHPTGLADLRGLRSVVSHETDETAVLADALIKQLTGGDRIRARFMARDFFEFAPTHKLQLVTNFRPQIRATDHGTWRRVILVPYMVRFGSAEQVQTGEAAHVKDMTLADKLAAELPGILAWVVRGAVEWHQSGLRPPDAVRAASDEYRSESDRVAKFIAERCELGTQHEAVLNGPHDSLYQAYRVWAHEAGGHPLGRDRFIEELKRLVPGYHSREGRTKDTRQKIRLISGICLAPS